MARAAREIKLLVERARSEDMPAPPEREFDGEFDDDGDMARAGLLDGLEAENRELTVRLHNVEEQLAELAITRRLLDVERGRSQELSLALVRERAARQAVERERDLLLVSAEALRTSEDSLQRRDLQRDTANVRTDDRSARLANVHLTAQLHALAEENASLRDASLEATRHADQCQAELELCRQQLTDLRRHFLSELVDVASDSDG